MPLPDNAPPKSIPVPRRRFWHRRPRFLRRRRHVLTAAVLAAGVLLYLAAVPAEVRLALARGLLAHGFLLALVIIFSLLELSLLWSASQSLESWVFLYLNLHGRRPRWLDWSMLAVTQFGGGIGAVGLVVAAFIFGDRRLAYEVVLGVLTLGTVVELVKALVGRSRPAVRLTQTRIVGWRQPGRSFPSGHASQSFFLVTLVVQHFSLAGWAVAGLYLLATLVAITRMYVGAHYPRDVLAGAILGSLWGLLGGLVDARFFAGIR